MEYQEANREVLSRVVQFVRTIRRGRDYRLAASAVELEAELAARLAAMDTEEVAHAGRDQDKG